MKTDKRLKVLSLFLKKHVEQKEENKQSAMKHRQNFQ